MPNAIKQLNVDPKDVARYFLYRATAEDGDTITPLRMQKLVYYAYSHVLTKNNTKLFNEQIKAWVNGPVVPSLYRALKDYGRSPIGEEFLDGINDQTDFDKWTNQTFPAPVLETIEEVYEEYMQYTPFELVSLTHREKPWLEARKGLGLTDASAHPIADSDIVDQYKSV